jgi:hypothetical protein
MPQVVKYKIVLGGSLAELEKKINEDIAKGWQPFGGLTAGSEGWLYQAMVMSK